MAALLKQWINEELGLSTTITSLEMGFANGYYFGEVMSLNDRQADFDGFVQSNATDAKVDNFTKLIPTLKKIGVTLDKKLANQIMTEQRGAAAKLLYQIKDGIKKAAEPEPIVKLPATHSLRPKQKIPKRTDFLSKTIEKVGFENFNAVDMAIHLKKFDEEQEAQERKADDDMQLEDATSASVKRKRRELQLARARSQSAFLNDWTNEGTKQWALNQHDKARREQIELKYELSLIEKSKKLKELDCEKHQAELAHGIEEYERALKRLGLGADTALEKEQLVPVQGSGIQHLKKLESKVGEQIEGPGGNKNMMRTLKGQRKEQIESYRERDRRQRKNAFDAKQTEMEGAQEKETKDLLSKLLDEGRKQRAQAAQQWHKRHTQINTRIQTQRDLQASRAKFVLDFKELTDERAVLCRAVAEAEAGQKTAQMDAARKARDERKDAKHQRTSEWCTEIAYKLADLTCRIVEERARVQGPIDPQTYRVFKQVFISREDLYEEDHRKEFVKLDRTDLTNNMLDCAAVLEYWEGTGAFVASPPGTKTNRVAPSPKGVAASEEDGASSAAMAVEGMDAAGSGTGDQDDSSEGAADRRASTVLQSIGSSPSENKILKEVLDALTSLSGSPPPLEALPIRGVTGTSVVGEDAAKVAEVSAMISKRHSLVLITPVSACEEALKFSELQLSEIEPMGEFIEPEKDDDRAEDEEGKGEQDEGEQEDEKGEETASKKRDLSVAQKRQRAVGVQLKALYDKAASEKAAEKDPSGVGFDAGMWAFVPPDLMATAVACRALTVAERTPGKGWVMQGYPHTKEEAIALQSTMFPSKEQIEKELPPDEGAGGKKVTKPPKAAKAGKQDKKKGSATEDAAPPVVNLRDVPLVRSVDFFVELKADPLALLESRMAEQTAAIKAAKDEFNAKVAEAEKNGENVPEEGVALLTKTAEDFEAELQAGEAKREAMGTWWKENIGLYHTMKPSEMHESGLLEAIDLRMQEGGDLRKQRVIEIEVTVELNHQKQQKAEEAAKAEAAARAAAEAQGTPLPAAVAESGDTMDDAEEAENAYDLFQKVPVVPSLAERQERCRWALPRARRLWLRLQTKEVVFDPENLRTLVEMAEAKETAYTEAVQHVFPALREQRLRAAMAFRRARDVFVEFVQQPVGAQEAVDQLTALISTGWTAEERCMTCTSDLNFIFSQSTFALAHLLIFLFASCILPREDIEVKTALNSKLDALEEDLSDLLEARTDEAEVCGTFSIFCVVAYFVPLGRLASWKYVVEAMGCTNRRVMRSSALSRNCY
jgi:hypothetical protein